MKNRIITYFSRNTNNTWLPFFRIAIAAFCLLHFIALLPDLRNLLSSNSYILPEIVDSNAPRFSITIFSLTNFLQKYLHVTLTLSWFSGVYITALSLLLLGVFSRPSAIVAAFCHVVLVSSIDFFSYGLDYFCTVALFYCVLFPVGSYGTLAHLLGKKKDAKPDQIYANICLKVLQVHVCIIYFFSGFDKAIGANWWNGESIWKALHLSYDPKFINVDFLAGTPVFAIIGWLTLTLETLYPVFINIGKTRKFWLFAVIVLHVSIAFFLGLFFFSTFMILLNIAAYHLPFARQSVRADFIRKSFGEENRLIILVDGTCRLCTSFVAKLSGLNVNNGNYSVHDLKSEEAEKILSAHGKSAANLTTTCCLYNGELVNKSAAIFLVLSFARKPYCYLAVFRRLPRFVTDGVYSSLARVKQKRNLLLSQAW